MEANNRDVLVKLSDTDETVKLGDEDIRGYSVKDKQGADIGKVDDLLIDPHRSSPSMPSSASPGTKSR